MGKIAAEAKAIKHSLKHHHPVDIQDDKGNVITIGENRTIPMFDEPPF